MSFIIVIFSGNVNEHSLNRTWLSNTITIATSKVVLKVFTNNESEPYRAGDRVITFQNSLE